MWFWLQTTVLSLLLSSIYPKQYTQNIWEDFINISSVWKRTQENFCDQHTVLGTKMPCSPLPVTWMQWPAEFVPAVMENLCRCSQDRVTHICELRVGRWEQGGWDTHNARRVGVGNHCHSTSACHWTHDKTEGTSLRENSSSHEYERLGKGGQIRELETVPCVICPVPSCSQGFCATIQVCMCVTIYLTWNLLFLPF